MANKTNKSLAIGAAVVGIYGAILVGAVGGANAYRNYNAVDVDPTNGQIELRQMDGIVANSSLETYEKDYFYPKGHIQIKIDEGMFRDTTYYYAETGSMEVYRVNIQYGGFTRGFRSQSFDRDKHLERFPQIFEKADKEFAKKYEEFKPRLEEMLSNL